MLKKINRLPSSVRLESAKTVSTSYFILKIAKSNLSYPRFAFVISKKVDKRAVIRNKIKREMTKTIQNMIEQIGGIDILFILKTPAAENITRLASSIEQVFSKEGLLK